MTSNKKKLQTGEVTLKAAYQRKEVKPPPAKVPPPLKPQK